MSQRKKHNMKIEGLFENGDLTIDTVMEEIKIDFPFANLSPDQILALSRVRLLERASILLREEEDFASRTAADGISDRAHELKQDENYLSALKLIGGRTGGME